MRSCWRFGMLVPVVLIISTRVQGIRFIGRSSVYRHLNYRREYKLGSTRVLDTNFDAFPTPRPQLSPFHRYVAETSRGLQLDVDAFSQRPWRLIHLLGSKGRSEDALRLFSKIRKDRDLVACTRTYNAALEVSANTQHWERTISLLKEMIVSTDANPTVESYATVMEHCVRTRQWREVVRLFEEMRSQSMLVNLIPRASMNAPIDQSDELKKRRQSLVSVHLYAIQASEKLGHWEVSSIAFSSSQDLKLRLPPYCASMVLRTCAKASQWNHALPLVNQVIGHQGRNIKNAGLINVNIAASVCAHAGRVAKTEWIIGQLKDHGFERNVYSYMALLQAYAVTGQASKAVDLVHYMTDPSLNLKLDMRPFNAALGACVKSQARDTHLLALRILKIATDHGLVPDIVFCSIVMVECSKSGDDTSALEVFGSILIRDIPSPSHVSLHTVLGHFAQQGRSESALELLRLMRLNGNHLVEMSYHTVMAACCKAKDYRGVVTVYDEMRSHDLVPNSIGYSMVIKAASSLGDASIARRVLTDFFTSMEKTSNDAVASSLVARVLKLTARVGQPDAVEDLIGYLSARTSPTSEWSAALVTASYKNGSAVETLRTLDRVQEMGYPLSVECFVSAMSACRLDARHDQEVWRQGLHLLSRCKRAGIAPTTVLYNALLYLLTIETKVDLAEQVLEDMRASNVSLDVGTYTSLMVLHNRTSDWRNVLSYWHEANATSAMDLNMVAYRLGMRACEILGDGVTAMAMVNQMHRNGLLDTSLLKAAISAVGKRGHHTDVEKAIDLLEHMERDYGVVPNTACFAAAISACERGPHWRSALSLLATMIHHHLDPNVYVFNSAIRACLRSHEWQKALDLVDAMPKVNNVFPDETTLAMTVSAFCGKGDHWSALQALQHLADYLAGPTQHPSNRRSSNTLTSSAGLVIEACVLAGDHDLAVDVFQRYLGPPELHRLPGTLLTRPELHRLPGTLLTPSNHLLVRDHQFTRAHARYPQWRSSREELRAHLTHHSRQPRGG